MTSVTTVRCECVFRQFLQRLCAKQCQTNVIPIALPPVHLDGRQAGVGSAVSQRT